MTDLSPSDRAAEDRAPWLFERTLVDGHDVVDLSPLGHFLLGHERGRRHLQREVRVARHLVGTPALGDAIDRLLAELNGPRRDDLLFHERAFKHHGTGWHAWKTESGGKFRLVWRQREPHVVEVREAWIDQHDVYERRVKEGSILDGADIDGIPFDRGD